MGLRVRRAVTIITALFLLSIASPAEASTTSTWDYPTQTSSLCLPNPQIACFSVPDGAEQATISIADDHSAHVTGFYQVSCGDPAIMTCVEFTDFCDGAVVDLPPDSAILYVAYDSAEGAVWDTVVEPAGCADVHAYGTTGTITVVWD